MPSFPKTPNKKITGSLKLTVRSPDTKGDLEDSSSMLSPSMPNGFSVKQTMKEVLDGRIKYCIDSIQEINEKSLKCTSCKRLSVDHESSCYDILGAISNVGSLKEDKIGLVFGQNSEGDITLDLVYSTKLCKIIVHENSFSVGFYNNDSLVREEINVPITDWYKFLIFLIDTEN
jgi:hypothetical protein